jgi:hypothetical protein
VVKSAGQSLELGASGGPTELKAASTTTAEHFPVGARIVVAIQPAAAAKGCGNGGGGTDGADAIKEGGVVGVAPEEEATGDTESGEKT